MPTRPATAAPLTLLRLLSLLSVAVAVSAASVPSLCESEVCKCDGATAAVTCSCAGLQQQELSVGAAAGDSALPAGTASLRVERCANVTVGAGAVAEQPRLRRVHLAQITALRLRTRAFAREPASLESYGALPALTVTIEHCNDTVIESFSFRDHIEDIFLHGLHITHIAAFSFASLSETERLEIINCTIDNIEGQAFKRFSVETFVIAGGSLSGEVHSRTLSDITVTGKMHIDGITMDHIRSWAFDVGGPAVFTLRGCNINRTYGEAFKVVVKGPVEIRNNNFLALDTKAFAGFSVDSYSLRHGLRRVTFENNTIKEFAKGSLSFNRTGLEIVMKKVLIDQPCSCSSLELWSSYINRDVQHIQLKRSASLSAEDILWCVTENTQKTFIRSREFHVIHCSTVPSGLNLFLLIVIPISVLLLILGICIFLVRRKRLKNQKHWVSVPTSNTSKEGDKNNMTAKEKSVTPENKLKLVVPDGRTYRETELHVIVERAEPIADNYLIASNDAK